MPFRSPIPFKNTNLQKSTESSFNISKPFISKFEIDEPANQAPSAGIQTDLLFQTTSKKKYPI
jgi:hypothetical protein